MNRFAEPLKRYGRRHKLASLAGATITPGHVHAHLYSRNLVYLT